jgi:hypothetical protein
MSNTQGYLIAAGFVIVVFAMFIPNFKPFVTGYRDLIALRGKPRVIDTSHIKRYIISVVSLSIICGLYNFAITRDMRIVGQFTGLESFFLAVGLITPVLYKKDKPQK